MTTFGPPMAVEAKQAFDFITVPLATRFALDRSLPGLEIVLRYHGLPDEVTMPILAEFCGLDRLGPAAQ